MSSEFLPPKGMRDFDPATLLLRRKIINKIKKKFQEYGFDEIETPIVERWEILAGKYGEEAENRLIWRFKLPYSDKEFGLRYDLTVPLARFVARFSPRFPFKRYQIGPVFRYEDPQKGRYREFLQCDADIIGACSYLADVEILNLTIDVLKELGLQNFTIKLNDRRILFGLFKTKVGIVDNLMQTFRIIDKLDKIGLEGVIKQLSQILDEEKVNEIKKILMWAEKNNEEIINYLKSQQIQEVTEGVENLEKIIKLVKEPSKIKLDISLVRGLDYYTSTIFEVVVDEPKIGSIAAGGRYDELLKMFTNQKICAVGISFGIERIIDAGLEIGLFSKDRSTIVQLGIIYTEDVELKKVFEIASGLRKFGLSVYMPYEPYRSVLEGIREISKREVPFALIIGKKEIEKGEATLQNLKTREKTSIGLEDLSKIKEIVS